MSDESDPSLFDPYTYEGSSKVQVSHAYFMIAFAAVLFYCVNYALILTGPTSSTTRDVWRWRNTLVSCIHAAIVGTGVLYCLMLTDMIDDPVLFCDPVAYFLVTFSLGYFIYDFFDYLTNKKLVTHYEVSIHHICAIWCFWYAVSNRVNIGYGIYGLMTEVNSVFLHARKVMQLSKWPSDHWLYRSVIALNLFTFIVFRFAGLFMVMLGLFIETKRTTTIFLSAMWVIVTVMFIINPILLWRLIKNDILGHWKKSKVELNGNNNTSNMKLD